MDKCREEFEKLPGISTFLPGFKFNEATNEYERSEEFTLPEYTLGFFNGAWYAFQHQQAKVDELQNNINLLNEALDIKEQLNQKLREREDELQKQLSEYIFVSETLDEMYVKEAQKSDELQKRVDALELKLREIAGIARRARHGEYYTESGRNAGLNIAAQLEQALKGDQYDEHRKKAEEAISKGASLTNHRIEL
ncbi:TPA: hypothetical protein JI084_15775 [Acinetobacter baumannii]|nr:hypothetical protein [Acinetobacter baumannii]